MRGVRKQALARLPGVGAAWQAEESAGGAVRGRSAARGLQATRAALALACTPPGINLGTRCTQPRLCLPPGPARPPSHPPDVPGRARQRVKLVVPVLVERVVCVGHAPQQAIVQHVRGLCAA